MTIEGRSQGSAGGHSPGAALACLLLCSWPALLQGAVLQRPPQGEYGANDIYRGGKTTPSIRDVVNPPHGIQGRRTYGHFVLPTSSEQPIKQIPPPPPSLEGLRPTPSLSRAGSRYYFATTATSQQVDDLGPSWSTAEGVLGQPQFKLLWATEGPASSQASHLMEVVTRAAVPASLTPHST